MTVAATTASLLRLSKEEQLMLADPAEDTRDKKMIDKGGEVIAKVEDLLIDEKDHKVSFLMVGSGGFGPKKIGKKKFLIPVDAITKIDDEGVHVDQSVHARRVATAQYTCCASSASIWASQSIAR